MPKLDKLPMATNKEQLGHLVDRLQHASPEQIEITDLPDGGMVIHFYAMAPKSKPAEGNKGKWAKIAEEFANKAPLNGMSEEFLSYTKEFRENFSLKTPI